MNLGKLPLRNLARRPARTAALTLLVAFLAFAVFAGSVVITSLRNGLGNLEARLGADVIVIPYSTGANIDLRKTMIQDAVGEYYMPRENLEKIAAIEGVEAVTAQTYLSSMKASCCSAPIQIIGFDPATDFTVAPWVSQRYTGELAPCDIVIGSSVGLMVGSSIRFFNVPCTVVARLGDTGTSMDTAAYTTDETIRILLNAARDMKASVLKGAEPEDVVSAVFVKVIDGYDPQRVAGLVNAKVRRVKAGSARTMISAVSDSLNGVQSTVMVLIAAIWVLAFILLAVAFAMMVNERRREFAVLRVIGTSRRMLSRMILSESALLSLLGGLIGVALAALVVYPFGGLIESRLNLPFLMPGIGPSLLLCLGTLMLMVLVGAAASARTAFRLSRVDPGITLREGN